MKSHQTFLELAAMAIDYPLTSSERRHLDEHLAGCQDCVRSASALRADASAIGQLPPITLSDRRGDLILAAALRPSAAHHPLRLVAIAALLGLLITGSLAVGALLMNRPDNNLSIVVPVPSPTASPSAVPSASPGPTPTDGPGGTLAVTGEYQQQSWIEVLPPDGSVTRLAQGSNPAWLDADTIVYECSQPSQSVCTVDLATPGSVRVIASDANHPAPAPDGRSIAFHRSGIDVGETWIVNPDGSGQRLLAPGWLLEWSPDGYWLAGQMDGAAVQVAVAAADGSGLRPLAPGHDPAWSPSSDRLVYLYNDEQGAASLRTVDVATGEVKDLWGGSQADLSDPAWLGDRGWVFVRDGDIWRLDVGASRPVSLGAGLGIESGSLTSDPLAVSADFGWVAYTSGIDTDARVGITSVSGSLGSEYLEQAMSDPRWAPEPGSPAPKPTPGAPVPSSSASSPPPSGPPAPVGEGHLGWTWTAASVPPAPGRPDGLVEAVTAGGPGFVAVGRGCLTTVDPPTCEGVVWTSADGHTWVRGPASDATDTGATFPTSGPELGMYGVASGTPGVVAIGYAARPDLQATIWFSPDAATWERIPLGLDGPGTAPGDPLAVRINGVTWDGGQFVVVGEDRSDLNGRNLANAKARAAVWTSPDGRAWTRAPHTAELDVGKFVDTLEDPGSGGMGDVVMGPQGLVAVGSVCDGSPNGCHSAAWTSIDGQSWEQAPEMLPARGALTSVVASSSAYLAVGLTKCQGCATIAVTSTDGLSWNTQEFDHRGHFDSIAVISEILFAISSDPAIAVWTSGDGMVWLQSAAPGGPATGNGVDHWHLAASSDTAVWLGSPADSSQPAAWVSDRTFP